MKVEEGRIIKENPLRILGVFSDTPKKVIVANLGKLRAFAKTGKTLSFESDFTSLLGSVKRTSESIEKANNDISLPKDKLQAGMFWFMQHTDNDKAALDCLKSGDANEAMAIIQKKGNYSGVVNMAVLALILKRWDIALYSYAFLLESPQRRGALIKSFTDTEDYFSEEDLVEFISNKLIGDFPSAHWLEQIQHENVELGDKIYPFKSRFENSKLLNKIASECTITIKKAIDEVLDKASSVSRKDANANLSMANSVEEKCKPLLKELRIALGKENNTYIEYADNIANQILDNCIDYYTHDADNPKRAQNVIKYTRFAYRTAESKTTKERAKKNLDILNETIENVMPDSIEEEFKAIDKLVMNYHDINTKIDYSDHLGAIIDEAYKKILAIKDKVGKDNKHYISISSNFVYFAFQEIVKKINAFSNNSIYTERNKYVSTLQWGRSLFDALAKFDKDEECQADFDKNFTTLIDLIRKTVVKPVPPKPKTSQSSTQSSRTTSQTSNSTTYTHVYSRQTTKKETEKTNDSSLPYIFGGLGLVAIVVMLIVSLSNNHRIDNNRKAPESTYNTDNHQKSEESANVARYETDETSTIKPESSTVYENESETSTTLSSDNTYGKEMESFTTVSFSTGDRPYQSTYGKGSYDSHTQNSLLIKNGSSTDAVVFLERTNGKKVRHVYIERGQNFTMTKIPGGEYIIKVMQGTDWNPEKDNGPGNPKGGFMYSCSISKSESYDAFDYPYPSSGQYGQYEVTLYKVQNGNMQTESINENDLF